MTVKSNLELCCKASWTMQQLHANSARFSINFVPLGEKKVWYRKVTFTNSFGKTIKLWLPHKISPLFYFKLEHYLHSKKFTHFKCTVWFIWGTVWDRVSATVIQMQNGSLSPKRFPRPPCILSPSQWPPICLEFLQFCFFYKLIWIKSYIVFFVRLTLT